MVAVATAYADAKRAKDPINLNPQYPEFAQLAKFVKKRVNQSLAAASNSTPKSQPVLSKDQLVLGLRRLAEICSALLAELNAVRELYRSQAFAFCKETVNARDKAAELFFAAQAILLFVNTLGDFQTNMQATALGEGGSSSNRRSDEGVDFLLEGLQADHNHLVAALVRILCARGRSTAFLRYDSELVEQTARAMLLLRRRSGWRTL